MHKRAPAFKHDLKSTEVVKPINQPLGNLPYIWAKYVERVSDLMIFFLIYWDVCFTCSCSGDCSNNDFL